MTSRIKPWKLSLITQLCLLFSHCFAQEKQTSSRRFHSANNAFEKRVALRNIGNIDAIRNLQPVEAASGDSLESSLSSIDIALLEEALKDPHPTVVDQSVILIGKLKVVELNKPLLEVYANANNLFPGYSERIQISVIRAIGNIRSPENEVFLTALIDQQVSFSYMHEVLQAIKTMHAIGAIENIEKLLIKYNHDYQLLGNSMDEKLVKSELQIMINEAMQVLASLNAQQERKDNAKNTH